MSEINNVNILNFDEFSGKKIYPKVQNNKVIIKYLHELGQGRLIDRAYVYDVLSTLYPDCVADIINGAYAEWSGDANKKWKNYSDNTISTGLYWSLNICIK